MTAPKTTVVALMWEARAVRDRGAELLEWARAQELPLQPLRRESFTAGQDRVLVITWWHAVDAAAPLPGAPRAGGGPDHPARAPLAVRIGLRRPRVTPFVVTDRGGARGRSLEPVRMRRPISSRALRTAQQPVDDRLQLLPYLVLPELVPLRSQLRQPG